jgi:hypothetical protein
MKKEITTSRHLTIHSVTSWKAVLEYLKQLNFGNSQHEEVRIMRKNQNWEVQSSLSTNKSKPKILTTKCRGVGLFDLNW